jgi:hypothetical protein
MSAIAILTLVALALIVGGCVGFVLGTARGPYDDE